MTMLWIMKIMGHCPVRNPVSLVHHHNLSETPFANLNEEHFEIPSQFKGETPHEQQKTQDTMVTL